MSKWMVRASQYVLIGALWVSLGGHLALLQMIAWGGMLVDHSSKSTLVEAVGKTFDGQHPCSLCKVVKKTKGEEEKTPLLKPVMKMDPALPTPVKVPFPRSTAVAFRVTEYLRSYGEIALAVPTRPPRAA